VSGPELDEGLGACETRKRRGAALAHWGLTVTRELGFITLAQAAEIAASMASNWDWEKAIEPRRSFLNGLLGG
jgi:hypothetical protein